MMLVQSNTRTVAQSIFFIFCILSSEVSLAMEHQYRWWPAAVIAGIGLTIYTATAGTQLNRTKRNNFQLFDFFPEKGFSPLSESNYKTLEKLITGMNDINMQCNCGTPLHNLIFYDPLFNPLYNQQRLVDAQLNQDVALRCKLAKLLIHNQAGVNIRDLDGLTPLQRCNHNNISLIKILLDAKADPNIGNKKYNDHTVVNRSLYQDNGTQLVPLLIKHGGQYCPAIKKVLTQDRNLFDQSGNHEAFRTALRHIGDCSLTSRNNSRSLLLEGYLNREWTNTVGKKIPWKGATILFQHQLQRETKAARIFRQLQLFPCAVEDIVIDYFQVMDHHSPVEQPIIKPEFVAMMMQNAQSANTQHRP